MNITTTKLCQVQIFNYKKVQILMKFYIYFPNNSSAVKNVPLIIIVSP